MTFVISQCIDSFPFLAGLEPGAADVIITDPPYSEHVQKNLCSGSLVGKKSVPKYELPFEPMKSYIWLEDAVRAATRWVISFCDLEAFGLIRGAVPDAYVRGCVWYKPNAMGQLTADRPATSFEGVACLHRPELKKRWNGKGAYGAWRCNGTRGLKGRHPNEKPIDLCLKLVALFSERGETVLDPFCGSGVIGEACVRLGRNYIGLDSSEEWVGKARERLEKVQAGFDAGLDLCDEFALGLCSMRGEDPPME